MIRDALQKVSADRIRRDLFYLCRDPLLFRKVNYTRPGQKVCSLVEADEYIRGQARVGRLRSGGNCLPSPGLALRQDQAAGEFLVLHARPGRPLV